MAATTAARLAKCCDWRVVARVFMYRRVEWGTDSFAQYKMVGMDILPALLQEEQRIVVP